MNYDQQTTARNGGLALDLIEAPVRSRRLSDKIFIAFHQACDQSDYDTAEQLLHVLDFMVARQQASPDPARRKTATSLVAAYERLWLLRHPDPKPEPAMRRPSLHRA